MRHYKFDCHVPLGKTLLASVVCVLLTAFTVGLALPYCLVMLAEIILNSTEVVEQPN